MEAVDELKAEVNRTLFVNSCMKVPDPEAVAAGADLGFDIPATNISTVCQTFVKKHVEGAFYSRRRRSYGLIGRRRLTKTS